MTEIIYRNESYAIIGACFECTLEGCGFGAGLSRILAIEFEHQRIRQSPNHRVHSVTVSARYCRQ